MAGVCEKVSLLCTDPRLSSHPRQRLQVHTAAGHLAAGAAEVGTKEALVSILLAQTPTGACTAYHHVFPCLKEGSVGMFVV
jgi:hypothetical protein